MKHLLLSVFLFVFAFSAFTQNIPERPNPPRLVNDLANVLTDQEEQQLESELDEFDRSTTTQITIVTVPSLEGYDISDFAFQLGEKWGVGQKGKNNGIVIVFKPKMGNNDKGRVFVAIGYGLEGIIPDAVANGTVVKNEMIPRFAQNDIYGGLEAGVRVLEGLASKEFTAQAYQKKASEKQSKDGGGGFIVVIIIIIVLISLFRGGRGRHYNGGSSSLPFWIAMGLLGSGNRGHGSFGGFSGGGGGFGGGGGGGFGGFGGGSFGGGGAGGSW